MIAKALASLSASLVGRDDALSQATGLLEQCCGVLSADSAAILVLVDDELELLVASCHATSQLEMHQTRLGQGPCEASVSTRAAVQVSGHRDLIARWPLFAPAMISSGFASVRAAPLLWHGEPLGSLVLYCRNPHSSDPAEDDVLSAFADIATVMLLQTPDPSAADIAARLGQALSERIRVEQAKGVVAEATGCDMEQAHRRVLARATSAGVSVTAAAAAIVSEAIGPRSA